jgi:hypothetical protein
MNGWVAWQITQCGFGLVTGFIHYGDYNHADYNNWDNFSAGSDAFWAAYLGLLLIWRLSRNPLRAWQESECGAWSSLFCSVSVLSANHGSLSLSWPTRSHVTSIPLLTLSSYLGRRNCILDTIVNLFTIVAFSKHVTVFFTTVTAESATCQLTQILTLSTNSSSLLQCCDRNRFFG